ncbi:MAG: metallophosphoesterase [Candidatus Odinarchaeia archaeon]
MGKDDIQFLEGVPYLYIKSLNALVGADLHLGYEIVLAEEEGYFIPQGQFKEIISELDNLLSKFNAEILIVNGDLKHKFSMRTRQETREVISFLDFISSRVKKCFIIRGNHDNFVRGLFERYKNVEFIEPWLELGNYIFTHGHILTSDLIEKIKEKILIIGHEHPALLLYDDVGGKIKVPAFLHGSTKYGKTIIVLPPVSPLMSGTEFNLTSQNEVLSPILRELVNIRDLTPYAMLRGKCTLTFPPLSKWGNILD